jgi:hypothetical protein
MLIVHRPPAEAGINVDRYAYGRDTLRSATAHTVYRDYGVGPTDEDGTFTWDWTRYSVTAALPPTPDDADD